MKIKAVSGITLRLLLVMLLICSFPPIVKAETTGTTEKSARAYGTAGTTSLGLETVATLIPIADSYVNSSSPDSNYGSETSIKTEITTSATKNYTYIYIMFDLSSIPLDAVITSSNLSLYMISYSGYLPWVGGTIYVHYCSDTSWTEPGITWNNKPPFDPDYTSSKTFGWPSQKYYDWDVTSDVSRALSNGKLTEVIRWYNYTTEDYWGKAGFQSKEALNKPKLIVEYLRVPTAEKYALLLSGGVDSTYNYPRYRNDLSFLYKTLLNYYNFQEDHVITIYFDGSFLDLDSDGDNDVDYAATEPNVNTAFNRIKASLDADDLFLIFVTDHGIGYDREADLPSTGGFDDILREDLNGFPVDEGDEHEGYGYDEAICLWDSDDDGIEADEVILDDELATLVSGATGTLVFVLKQCFSGGFVDDLSESGRIIMTSCLEEETSLSIAFVGDEYNYGCFAYHWTAAVEGCDADANLDRQISIQEAFNYAIANDEVYTSIEYDSVDTETCQIDDPDGKAGTTTLGLRSRIALSPIADSYVNSLQPNSNYGSEDRLKTQITSGTSKDYNFTYIMFDLTHIPSDVVIQSANLSLFAWSFAYSVPSVPGPKIYTHYCSNSSWTELGITWNNMPAFDPVATDYIDPPSVGYNTWNVTEDVINALSDGKLTEVLKWPNYTLPNSYAWIEFQSREETYLESYLIRAYKPKLTVFVTITGDVNADGKVDASDLLDLSRAYGSTLESSNWNPDCDLNGDKKVEALDLFYLSKNYGKTL
jgi:hypothetical protein